MTETSQGKSSPRTDVADPRETANAEASASRIRSEVTANADDTPNDPSELTANVDAEASASRIRSESTANVDDTSNDSAGERTAAHSSQGKGRKSSIRPAPADYRPSVRDPSAMRPMMVVRAGDAELTPGPLEASETSHTTEQPPESQDAFARAKRLAADAADTQPLLVIPAAPAVPIDLVPNSPKDRSSAPRTAASKAPTRCDVPGALDSGRESARSVADAPSGAPESGRRSRGPLAITLVAVGLTAIALVAVHFTSKPQPRVGRAPNLVESPPSAAAAAVDVVGKTAAAEPAKAEQPAVAPAAAAELAASASDSPAPVATLGAVPAPGTTRVRLDLKPIDAKAYVRGREVPGPPFEFDVGKGQHVAVEVVRFGFVTARVVLDDKKPVVTYGMLRERWKKGN